MESELGVLEIGEDLKESGAMEFIFKVIFGKCVTKNEYFERAHKFKLLFEDWGWQNEVNDNYKKWASENKQGR